ncbi:MAG: protein kinase [Pirellulaceae bacterium]|nr:protein kinase [Pirellulaceae bacterium]
MTHDPQPPSQSPPAVQDDLLDVTADLVISDKLVRLLDDYLEQLKAGRAPHREQLLADHPELARQLEACLAGIDFIQRTSDAPAVPSVIGGFRILREVGRGGMGAVYEAEDLTLGRRVALKVLRFGPVADSSAVDRFRREAETVAGLHHTNIVPIFAVGTEHGVNYYVMQFIAGRSLAEVAGDDKPLDVRQVAAWGLQAADALEHAHRRGVIHRDVKPSNLLLDGDDRIWLTDFGLARRRDDVTLSLTGALLGTPRYMSPEQASAARGQVDHRTDIYSLGATLYELATGRPVYHAESPHAILNQILSSDPLPARGVRPDVPRDLETILQKCLARQPADRYGSAAELAADLRAFLEGRPIQARRAPPLERLWRWTRKHHRSASLAVASVAATLTLMLAVALAVQIRTGWQQAHLSLATAGPPSAAQLFDAPGGRPATEKLSLPTHQPLAVAAGEYTIRLESEGRLSQDLLVRLPAGNRLEYSLDISDQSLWLPRQMEAAYVVVPGGDRSLVLLLDQVGIHQRGLATAADWAIPLAGDDKLQFADAPGLVWPWNQGERHAGRGALDLRPQPSPTVDLNGDGVRDIVLSARHQAWVLAISGRDGGPLWLAARGTDLLRRPAQPRAYDNQNIVSTVLGPAVPLPDINNDTIADLLVTLADATPREQGRPARRWIEALSGADGSTLWAHELEAEWFEADNDQTTPEDFRWFVGNQRQSRTAQSGDFAMQGIYRRTVSSYPRRGGEFISVPETARLIDYAGTQRICLTAGRQLCLLDPLSGTRVREVLPLPFRPGSPVRWQDVDGDGQPELIALEESPPRPPISEPQARLHVWSLTRQEILWQQPLESALPRRSEWAARLPDWPRAVDLDGDGTREIAVPNGGSFNQPLDFSQLPWGGLELRDARSGAVRWRREILLAEQQVSWFLEGPDADGDGCRELFVAGLWGNPRQLYVEALSGSDGRSVWVNHYPLPPMMSYGQRWIGSLQWWTRGTDGWPQLLVQLCTSGTNPLDALLVACSSGSGQITGTASGLVEFEPADLDGDRLDELLCYRPRDAHALDAGGTLSAIRGVAREAWRQVGSPLHPALDLDDDGLRDLMRVAQDGTFQAVSAATGQRLWSARVRELLAKSPRVLRAAEVPGSGKKTASAAKDAARRVEQDFNGDRIPDLLVAGRSLNDRPFSLMHALSGADGSRLWSADSELCSLRGMAMVACTDLDGDGNDEILSVVAGSWERPPEDDPWYYQVWLVALSARSGQLLWKHALTNGPDTTQNARTEADWERPMFEPRMLDLDRDGVLDVLLPAASDEAASVELRAISGRNGQTLWRHALPPTDDEHPVRGTPPPLVADLNRDGQPELYVLAFEDPDGGNGQADRTAHVRLIDPQAGTLIWSWQTNVPGYCGRLDSGQQKLQDRPLPLLVRRRAGPDLLAIPLWGQPGQLVLLDPAGQELGRQQVRCEMVSFRPWIADLDGDGNDDLLVVDQRHLQARRADAEGSLIWQQSRPLPWGIRVVDLLAGEAGKPATVVGFVAAPENLLWGFDGATGLTRWVCPAPLPRSSGTWLAFNQVEVLDQRRREEPPHALFGVAFLAVCRQAALVDDSDGGIRTRAVARLQRDMRRLRPLPWADHTPQDWRQPLAMAGWTVFFSLNLLLIPVGYLVVLARRRRWGLSAWALLPVVASLFVISLLVEPPDSAMATLAGRFLAAAAGVPAVVSLSLLVRWCLARRWRRVAAAGMLLPVSSLSVAALLIGFDRSRFGPATQYSWEGWYWPLLPGAYVATCLLCGLLVWFGVWHLARRTKARLTAGRTAERSREVPA